MTVRLFARLKDLAGADAFEMQVPSGASVQQVWDALAAAHPAVAPYRPVSSCAVNEEYAAFATVLSEGDEVAFLPPVSGGRPAA